MTDEERYVFVGRILDAAIKKSRRVEIRSWFQADPFWPLNLVKLADRPTVEEGIRELGPEKAAKTIGGAMSELASTTRPTRPKNKKSRWRKKE
jgi:hypothetical protein